MTVIKAENLKSKREDGVLNQVSFTGEKGEILGFAGIKNSGLSLLSDIVCGTYDRYEGSIKILDKELSKERSFLEHCGIYNRDIKGYREMTGVDHIMQTYIYKGKPYDEKELAHYMEEFSLSFGESKKKLKKYDIYETAALDLVCAHIGNPEIIILQDPTTSLREFEKERLIETIKEENKKGRTYIIFSPFSSILEEVCTRVFYLDKGKVITKETYIKERQREYEEKARKLRGETKWE